MSSLDASPLFQAAYLAETDVAALSGLLAEWGSVAPSLLLLLLPEPEAARVSALQAHCRQFGIALRGAIFPAILTEQGFRQSGMIVIRFTEAIPSCLVEGLADEPETAISRIDALLGPAQALEHSTLFLILDGILPNIASILNACYERIGHRVAYAGANAGSETFSPSDCIFDENKLVQGAGLAFLLPERAVVAVKHDYPIAQHRFRATSATGNCIAEIDGRPAMQVYQELLEQTFGIRLTQENFYELAVHFPFGLVTALDVLVRIPVGFSPDGSIHCVGEIPPNAVLRLLHAPAVQTSQGVHNLARQLLSRPGPLLTFYCAGRRMHFGGDAEEELRILADACATPALFGALSLGEIGTDREIGIPQFHNAALVCLR